MQSGHSLPKFRKNMHIWLHLLVRSAWCFFAGGSMPTNGPMLGGAGGLPTDTAIGRPKQLQLGSWGCRMLSSQSSALPQFSAIQQFHPPLIRFLIWLQDNTRHTSTYSLQGGLFVIAREYRHICMHMPLHFGRSTGGNRGWEKNMCWMILCLMKQKLSKLNFMADSLNLFNCFVIYSNSPINIMKHPILWRPRQRSIGVYFGTFDPIHENHVALAKFAFGRPKGWGSKLSVWGVLILRPLEGFTSRVYSVQN